MIKMLHNLEKIKKALRQVNLDFEADFMKREHLEKLTNEVLGFEKELREKCKDCSHGLKFANPTPRKCSQSYCYRLHLKEILGE